MTIRTLVPLLNVEDVSRSLSFYRDGLGFEIVAQHDDDDTPIWARLSAGDTEIMLNRPDHANSGGRATRPSYGDVVLYLMVDDAASLHRALGEKGLTVGPLERQAYGVDEFQMRDPDGYEIAIGSPVEGS